MQGYNDSQPALSAAKQHRVPPGLLPLQGRRRRRKRRRRELEFLRSTNNNTWGLGISEEGHHLRLDRQRQPQRLHADPQPLLRSGPRLDAAACCGGIADSNRFQPDHRQGPAGRLPRRLHRRRRPRPLHGPQLSRRNTGTAPPSSASRPGTSSARSCSTRDGSRLQLDELLEPAGQRRRMDRADHGRGRPRRQRLGHRLVQLHRPAQPHAAGFKTGKGAAYETRPARQEARPHLSRGLRRQRARQRQAQPIDAGAAQRPQQAASPTLQARQPVLAAARPAAAGRARQQRRRARHSSSWSTTKASTRSA